MNYEEKLLSTKWRTVTLIAILVLAGTILARGQTERVIHRFRGGRDGAYPSGGLISDKAGNFYGVTQGGKQSGSGGTVFQLSPPSGKDGRWTRTTLHVFRNGTHGGNPIGELIFDRAGNLYGTTPSGGFENLGTVFELKPQGGTWTETVIYNGSSPVGGLVFDKAGNLYGATYDGGEHGVGSVFQLTPSQGGGWTATVIYSFIGHEAYPPAGPIISKEGNLFGVVGGYSSGYNGAIYELKAPAAHGGAWTERVLYKFKGGSDGVGPSGRLVFDQKGNLYGTTAAGGAFQSGTVFQLTRQGSSWTEAVIYSFCAQYNCTDGAFPLAGLIFDGRGNLYGTSEGGGNDANCRYNCGTVFQLSPPVTQGNQWTEAVLYSFTGQGGDGYGPDTSLAHGKFGSLWGTTFSGRRNVGVCQDQGYGPGCGIVYVVHP
jgi:uncharacterized repeat protein (TIGR03803 family)